MESEERDVGGEERPSPDVEYDLACHKQCPLTLLLRSVPHSLDDVLELYYHCKLCSAPQAYIELETFVDHVQEFHPDYYQSPSTIVVYPQAKTGSSQTTEEDIKNVLGTDDAITTSGDVKSRGDSCADDLTGLPRLEQCDAIEFPPPRANKALKRTSARSLLKTDAGSAKTELDTVEARAPESVKKEKIVREATPERDLDPDEILLKIEGVSGDEDQPAPQPLDDGKGDVTEWREPPDEECDRTVKQEILDEAPMEVEPKGPRCKKCYKSYTPTHHPSCQREHTSEKPSCDAYVCAAENSQIVFPCRLCDRLFLTDALLSAHFSSHLDELKGQCDLCNREFDSQRRLLTHIRRCRGGEEEEEGGAACRTCHKVFTTHKAMLKHELQVHIACGSHICEICGRTFNRRSNLMTHLRFHSSDRPFKCKDCPMSFKAKSNLLRHRMRHTGVRPHMCEVCGKAFSDRTSLRRHGVVHTEEYASKLRQCRHCDAVLKSDRLLMKHIQSEHKAEEPNAGYSCDVCNKVFRDKHNMEAHKMIHTGERPFACKVCGKTFRKNPDLTIHSRVHTGVKPFKCDFCDMAFTTNSNLQKHRMSHTGERPHQCKLCHRRFIDKSHLNRHYLTHTGEKPHICAVCERRFATKAQCQQHMLIHTGEKPFICGACGKTFRQKAKAQKHRCLWKVIQKPGQAAVPYEIDSQSQNVFVQMGESVNAHGENQIAVRVIDPSAAQPSEQIAYQLVEPGQEGGEQVAYQIIESAAGGENGGGEQIAVRVVDPSGGVGGEQVAYQIVGEAGNHEELSEIAVRVLEQSAGQGGEQVAYQVVDEDGNQLAIQYEDHVAETV